MRPTDEELTRWPKVTIGIPTLDRAKYLKLALESALRQTYANFEVVVSNNVSTDETASLLESYNDPRLTVIKQEKRIPMIENWNACVSHASGEYFLLLSDDDLLEDDAIQQLMTEYLAVGVEGPGPGMVYGGGRIIDSEGSVTRVFKLSPELEPAKDTIIAFFEGKRDLWLCAILYRTSELQPGFTTKFALTADTAMWIISAIAYGSVAFVPKEVVRYRVHQNATSTTPADVWCDELIRLGELAISLSTKHDGPDDAFAQRLRDIIRQSTIRTIPARINQSFGDRKWRALGEYRRCLPRLLNPLGLKVLCRGIVLLFIGNEIRTLKRRLARKGS